MTQKYYPNIKVLRGYGVSIVLKNNKVCLRNGTDIFTGEDGRLESVGDYPAKIMGAHHAGLKLFLLPRESLAEAKEDEDMRVIRVRIISEAWYLVRDDSSTQFTEMLFQSLSSAWSCSFITQNCECLLDSVSYKDKRVVCCACSHCQHELRTDCVQNKCYCCDLEDMFSLLTKTSAAEHLW